MAIYTRFEKETHGYVNQALYDKLIEELDGESFSSWLRKAIHNYIFEKEMKRKYGEDWKPSYPTRIKK